MVDEIQTWRMKSSSPSVRVKECKALPEEVKGTRSVIDIQVVAVSLAFEGSYVAKWRDVVLHGRRDTQV